MATISQQIHGVTGKRAMEWQGGVEATFNGIPDRSIEILDLYFHGAPGTMQMGRDEKELGVVLFWSDETMAPLYGNKDAKLLRKYLAPTAHIRLLGCNTAVGRRGRLLVYKLACELGEQRVVSGTIDNLEANHFKAGRFIYDKLLFSSLGAIDGEAPQWDRRVVARPKYRAVNS